MKNKFIYAKKRSLFEQSLNNGVVSDEAIGFIEDTKEIWNHGTYFKCGAVDLSPYYTKSQIDAKGYLTSVPAEYITESELNAKGYLTGVPVGYVTEEELNAKGYLTEHQDISGKQDVISDLDTIRSGAALGATALQSVPYEYVTESELNNKGYLTSIPSEYVTESELLNMGYSTISYVDNKVAALVSGAPETLDTLDELAAALKDNKDIVTVLEDSITSKQDKINDIDTIRANASLGATALQSIPSEYITESELNAKGYLTSIPGEYITETELSNKGYATKAELTGYTTDAEYNTLVATVNSKANSSALSNYSTTSHTHGDLYYTETEIDSKLNTKQNVISDLDSIRSGASKGATALQSIPSEYAKITDVEEMIANAITLTLNTEV